MSEQDSINARVQAITALGRPALMDVKTCSVTTFGRFPEKLDESFMCPSPSFSGPVQSYRTAHGGDEDCATGTRDTFTAISHSLARLREQTGDPLVVKVGGKMQPSPHALRLIQDIRPILRSVQRAFSPPEPFDPATSTRIFRIALPAMTSLIAEVFARFNSEAPGVFLEWADLGPNVLSAVADEQIDLALMGADKTLPDGLAEKRMPDLQRYTFLRSGHPALEKWDRQAWLDWPHVMVGVSSAAVQTVEDKMRRDGLERRIGARLSEFSGVAPLLARTNMLWTTIKPFMIHDIYTYGLVA